MWRLKSLGVVGIAFGISLAGTALFAFNKGQQSGMSKVQSQWDAEVSAMAQAQAAEVNAARLREQELQAQITAQQRSHRNEVARINRAHAAALDGLRDRPEARAGDGGVPEGAAAGVGCTGAGLSRPDSEFLIWIGREAARTQAALNACVTAYDEVRRAVNGE